MADQRPRFRLPWLVLAPSAGRPAANRPAAETQDATQPPPSAETARPPLRPVRVVNPPPLAPPPPPPTAETEPTPLQQQLQLPSPPVQLPPTSTLSPQTATTQPPPSPRSDPQSQVATDISSPTQMDQPPPTVTLTQVAPPSPPSMSQPAQLEPPLPSSPSQISSSLEKGMAEPTLEPQGEVFTQQGELASSSYQKPSPGVGQELKNIDQNQPSPQEIEQTVSDSESEAIDQAQTKAPDGETMLSPVQEDIRSDVTAGQKPFPESKREMKEAEARIQSEQDIIDKRTKYPTNGELNRKVDTNLFSKQVHGEAKEIQDPNRETFQRKDANATMTHQKFPEPAMPTYPRVNRPLQRSAIPTREKAPFHKEIKEDMSKLVHKFGTGQAKQSSEDKPFSVITLAGENKGASMQLGFEKLKRAESIRIERGYKGNLDEGNESTTDGEGSSEGRKSRGEKADEELGTKAYINSNVQSINNSLVFNSSVNENNPGVQLLLSQIPTDPVKPNKDTAASRTEASKAKSTVAPATKLTYAPPNVRRRCLRGLFLESSDSDPDNPEKPQRHGCRYERREKNSGKIDDL